MYNKKEREDYNNRRAYVCEYLGIEKNTYNWFRRVGERLNEIYTANCNGDLTESEYEYVTDAIYKRVEEYNEGLGLHIYYQTDPRGATIYLDKKPIPENNYTTAYCIY